VLIIISVQKTIGQSPRPFFRDTPIVRDVYSHHQILIALEEGLEHISYLD